MVRREIKFELVEGDFETWKSLVPWIDQICENYQGTNWDRVWDKASNTCLLKTEFKNSSGYDNATIEITNLFSQHGIKEKVIESEDLVLRELAEAAGVA